MTYLHCFLTLIMQRDLRSICYLNIGRYIFQKKKKKVCVYLCDINIFREKGKVRTNVYRKRIFHLDVASIFKSFMTETYKIGLIKSFLFSCFSLRSDVFKFDHAFIKKYFL